MKNVLEGLLYIAGDDGLTLLDISNVLDISTFEVADILDELCQDYEKRGICIKCFGSRFKFVTRSEYADYYKKYMTDELNEKLSGPALEVLAIVAYKGPVTRNMLDEIRGVSCAHIVRKLIYRNLIKEVGKSDLPGRPILYGVTDQFLDYFGLKSLDELPPINLESNNDEVPLFESKYTEIVEK